jgi:hypothetical protein
MIKDTMKFIRLSSILINPAMIRSISFTDTTYTLNFMTERVNGMILFGSGTIESNQLHIVIDKNKQPSDYRTMESWISKNEHY